MISFVVMFFGHLLVLYRLVRLAVLLCCVLIVLVCF